MLVTGRKLPIGIQTFEDIRNDGYLYVDKTALMWTMANIGKPFFLSRPRRFGKSLLISTFEAYFKGRRDLFTGLAVEQLEKKWEEYPVLHLDLNAEKYDSPDRLDAILSNQLTQWEAIYGRGEDETTLSSRFLGVIRRASEQAGRGVVVLVDEYDKPLLQAIQNEPLLNSYRSTLKAFYGVLKSADRYLRFAFLTGVTKFSQVSVFSDLNQLNDISLNYDFSTLCGITREELLANFEPEIAALSQANDINTKEVVETMTRQYDGYHFHPNGEGVFNPFSVLNAFFSKEFGNYWFQTGTPTFLVELLKESDYDLRLLMDGIETAASAFTEYRADRKNPIPLIYQSGYLTIKGYDERFRMYKLGFPNQEVENGFVRYLLPYYSPKERGESEFFIQKFIQEVERGDAEAFMERLQTMFADNSYQVMGKMELYFQNCMYVIFKMMGFYTEVERTTHRGRIDIVIKTSDYIYVMEIKLDGSADEALRQIHEKGYAEPYRKDGRKVFLVGVDFSSDTKGVEEWKIEE